MAAETGAPSAALRLAHAAPGRLRYRIEDGPPSPAAAAALAEAVGELPGVSRVVVRPATGSVIVETGLEPEALAGELAARGIAGVLPPLRPPPLVDLARIGVARLDMGIRGGTAGELDLRSLLALGLVLGAAVQGARGRLLGPASTMLVAALALLETRR